ncbi:MAG: hypoxanthine phosphoribosyltransferase [Tannerellaceae bacterium]|jgi:hypoxanthine phosphoribosyltransferase|nr:hypoxanthine phosphoribosyltransferase [Tannerellaceae bacterium]
MRRIQLKDKQFELFITEEQLSDAISLMAAKIKADAMDMNPLFVGILNGAFMFIADLMRRLNGPYELAFARYYSYHGTGSTGCLQEVMPVSADVKGRRLILLEDIVDSGYTMHSLKKKFKADGAAEVRIATMLFKPSAMEYDARPDYAAMEIPNDFIVGHGLDYNGMGRAYRDIYRIVND